MERPARRSPTVGVDKVIEGNLARLRRNSGASSEHLSRRHAALWKLLLLLLLRTARSHAYIGDETAASETLRTRSTRSEPTSPLLQPPPPQLCPPCNSSKKGARIRRAARGSCQSGRRHGCHGQLLRHPVGAFGRQASRNDRSLHRGVRLARLYPRLFELGRLSPLSTPYEGQGAARREGDAGDPVPREFAWHPPRIFDLWVRTPAVVLSAYPARPDYFTHIRQRFRPGSRVLAELGGKFRLARVARSESLTPFYALQWVARDEIPTAAYPTRLCKTQSILIQIGDLGSAFSSLVICLNLLLILVFRITPATRWLMFTLLVEWIIIGILASVGPLSRIGKEGVPFCASTFDSGEQQFQSLC